MTKLWHLGEKKLKKSLRSFFNEIYGLIERMKISAEVTLKDRGLRIEPAGVARPDFKKALLQAGGNAAAPSGQPGAGSIPAATREYTVRPGDTMFSIARRTLEARGFEASAPVSTRAAFQLARSNGIANPDVIRPGQVINLASLTSGESPGASARADVYTRRTVDGAGLMAKTAPAATLAANPIMEKMLDRAVNLHYVEPAQKDAVREKIIGIASEYRFKPDDLATVMLMESDGMNPKANNGRCYGVIQFCEGTNKGAASVGYASNPKAILGLGVMDQLDLVKKYFDETGLKKISPAALDDLYLTVLKPASRKERSPTADLEIPGNQAAVLYPGSDRNLPITRQSLLAGLEYNARAKLAVGIARSAQPERVAALANGGSFIKAGFSGSSALAGTGETDGGRADHEL